VKKFTPVRIAILLAAVAALVLELRWRSEREVRTVRACAGGGADAFSVFFYAALLRKTPEQLPAGTVLEPGVALDLQRTVWQVIQAR
jgi:hypothetical protein